MKLDYVTCCCCCLPILPSTRGECNLDGQGHTQQNLRVNNADTRLKVVNALSLKRDQLF